MIELKSVTKKYRKQTALDDVSLTIPTGKIIGLVGANGSGKSTLLKLVSGLVKPSRGTVTFNHKEIDRRSSSFISYLSELDAYYSFFTVKETIEFYASQFKDFDSKKADEIREFMQLDSNKNVKDLSKGSRGRLKIVLTLARNVPIILMDEPLSGLDPMVRESIVKGLITFIDIEKQTLIITTHEINEIEPLLDLVIVIRDGRIIGSSEVEELRVKKGMSIVEWIKKMYLENW